VKEIIKITESTPIKEIVSMFNYSFYSKHTDWMHTILEEEIPYVIKAIEDFTEQLGEIKSKDTTWKAVFFGEQIKFFNCEKDKYECYYDMDEIDKRYINLRIEEWLEHS